MSLKGLVFTFIMASCSSHIYTPTQQPVQNTQPIIIGLDPGHGWGDSTSGAVGNDFVEKDYNLEIALLTKRILENNGFDVVMSREGDSYDKQLYQAAEIINKESPALVVSIHTNSGGDAASGTEACYTVGKSTDEQSKMLARLLTESISNNLSVNNRGIFPENSDSVCGRGWGRLYIHDMNAPTALIEIGFLSNPIEAELLKSKKNEYAQAISQAIMSFLGIQTPMIMSAAAAQSQKFGFTLQIATVQSSRTENEIAFVKDRKLWLMNDNGSDLRQLSTSDGVFSPRWSPDGLFLYYRVRDINDSLYMYDMASDTETRLPIPWINRESKFDVLPGESKKLIACNSTESDLSTAVLETIELDTGIISEIGRTTGFVSNIHASPSGEEVALMHCVQSCKLEIFNLHTGKSTLYNNLIFASTMAFFPTGESVVIEVSPGQLGLLPCSIDSCDIPGGLYELNLQTTEYKAIVLDQDYDATVTSPDISDDGQRIVFQIDPYDDQKIAVLDLLTGEILVIARGETPVWRPGL